MPIESGKHTLEIISQYQPKIAANEIPFAAEYVSTDLSNHSPCIYANGRKLEYSPTACSSV